MWFSICMRTTLSASRTYTLKVCHPKVSNFGICWRYYSIHKYSCAVWVLFINHDDIQLAAWSKALACASGIMRNTLNKFSTQSLMSLYSVYELKSIRKFETLQWPQLSYLCDTDFLVHFGRFVGNGRIFSYLCEQCK